MYFSLYNMKFKYGFGIGMYYKYVGGYYVVDINFLKKFEEVLLLVYNMYMCCMEL